MKMVLKLKWFILVFWVLLAIILLKCAPNMNRLVMEKGQPTIPGKYSSEISKNLAKELNNEKKDSKNTSILAVFHSSKSLTIEQINGIQSGVKNLQSNKEKLGIINITTHFNNKDLEDQLISKDKTTVIVGMNVNKKGRQIDEIEDGINNQLSTVTTEKYLTGQDLVINASVKTNLAGVEKSEWITIIFILVILLIVFRSPITPLVSLFTIGISYIVSLGLVQQLVDNFNFPFGSVTQTFLILTLFGIGTDYNILLLMRFKEELQLNSINEAIKNTYKTAGKTVLFSGLTVFIGFSVLALAKFSLFRAASAVAIGACVLILVLFTLLPFFMKILGSKMFWPQKISTNHVESKLWKSLTSFSVQRPFIALLVTVIVTLPIIFVYKGNLSYNTVKEVDSSYDAVKGVNTITKSFGAGISFPTTIYVKNNDRMDNNEYLGSIDKLSDAIKNVHGVDSVYSVTRPKGEVIKSLYVDAPKGTTATKTFFIPNALLKTPTFQKSLGAYMSKDCKIAKIIVNLSVDPYSEEAIKIVDNINKAVDKQVQETNLRKSEIGIGGASSVNNDLSDVADGDLLRTKIIMLIGIAIALIFITKSLFKPIYIIASLLISYAISMSATELIYNNLLNQGNLSWLVPFFTFIMLIALGVDYSIFLFMRFDEYTSLEPKEAITKAAASMGGIIISAVVILSGTFASMYPSKVPALVQLSTSVIIGLAFLAFLLLPIFVPSILSIGTKFQKSKDIENKDAVESYETI